MNKGVVSGMLGLSTCMDGIQWLRFFSRVNVNIINLSDFMHFYKIFREKCQKKTWKT